MEKNKNKELDKLNDGRVETTKLRVVHAIKLITNPIENMEEGRVIENAQNDIAHALNLLEAGVQEMRWACNYNDWNWEVCDDIDDACAKLGHVLANLIDDKADDYDPVICGCYGKEALACLAKALGTLVRWFDDEQDASEV